jgi:hypothetical protein
MTTRANEGRTSAAEIADGARGALRMIAAFVAPHRRGERSHWGATEADAARAWPGDDAVPAPRWAWHHAIEIAAPAADVWKWIVQLGQDKGGFYSYEALENLAGCRIDNAERIHPEWQSLRVGDALRLHPRVPPFPVAWVEPGRGFVVALRVEAETGAAVPPGAELPAWHVAASWGFFVEALAADRCRFVSRYRVSYPDDLRLELALGPTFVEPVGTAMDQRMLEGVKERAEAARA